MNKRAAAKYSRQLLEAGRLLGARAEGPSARDLISVMQTCSSVVSAALHDEYLAEAIMEAHP